MRDTARKRAILAMLESCDERQRLEYGMPPYTASMVSARIGGSVQSVARTLRDMAEAGELVAVRDRQDAMNAILGRSAPRTMTCYFSAATMEHDKEAAEAWRAGSASRSEKALQRLFR